MMRMRKLFWITLLILFFSSVGYAAKPIYILNIQGAIGPAEQNDIKQGLKKANEQQAGLVVINLDTPGGLDKSIRKIAQEITASSIPVVTYVGPAGAHVAN